MLDGVCFVLFSPSISLSLNSCSSEVLASIKKKTQNNFLVAFSLGGFGGLAGGTSWLEVFEGFVLLVFFNSVFVLLSIREK